MDGGGGMAEVDESGDVATSVASDSFFGYDRELQKPWMARASCPERKVMGELFIVAGSKPEDAIGARFGDITTTLLDITVGQYQKQLEIQAITQKAPLWSGVHGVTGDAIIVANRLDRVPLLSMKTKPCDGSREWS